MFNRNRFEKLSRFTSAFPLKTMSHVFKAELSYRKRLIHGPWFSEPRTIDQSFTLICSMVFRW